MLVRYRQILILVLCEISACEEVQPLALLFIELVDNLFGIILPYLGTIQGQGAFAIPVVVYGNLIRRTYKKTPVILGGLEASLRRMSHYDYWSDRVRRSILLE
ncbi:MAG: hypothetical protein II055_03805, partial [Prevotella sp.]|nr:hypothetical protein [Prevotella sp.]